MVELDWFAAALLAPLLVWVLWRVQGLAVDEVLRRALLKLLSYQRWLYNTVSWLGTFIHEASHATVLVLSGHGMKDFTVKADSGHVRPRRMRRGWLGFLGFLAAAIAPIYLPPAILMVGMAMLRPDILAWHSTGPGLDAALDLLGGLFITYPADLARATAALDLAHWRDAVLFVLVLIVLPSSRPSFVKGSKYHGRDEGDIAVVRSMIKKRPWPLLALFVVLYGLYFALVPWFPAVYWAPWQAIWLVALTGIFYALLAAVVWFHVAVAGRARWYMAWIPYALAILMQVAARTPAWTWDLEWANGASLLLFMAGAWAARATRPRRY